MIDNIIFRSSQAGGLMGVKGLGATGEKLAINVYLEYKYGRVKEFSSKYTDKGTKNESLSIQSYNEIYQTNYVKNEVRLFNDFITGECDVDDENKDTVLDIKNSWDLFTFHEAKTKTEANKLYEWQGQCYMELYNRCNFKLVYMLTDAPDEIVLKELERESYKHFGGETPEWREVQIINSMIFDKTNFERFINIRGLGGDELTDKLIDSFVHIPIEERVHIKRFERDKAKYLQLTKRITEARDFLKTIYDTNI
jgi:hypothetical protein